MINLLVAVKLEDKLGKEIRSTVKFEHFDALLTGFATNMAEKILQVRDHVTLGGSGLSILIGRIGTSTQ